jgi:hypothetical protein
VSIQHKFLPALSLFLSLSSALVFRRYFITLDEGVGPHWKPEQIFSPAIICG